MTKEQKFRHKKIVQAANERLDDLERLCREVMSPEALSAAVPDIGDVRRLLVRLGELVREDV